MQPFGTATEGGKQHWRAENITSMFTQDLSAEAKKKKHFQQYFNKHWNNSYSTCWCFSWGFGASKFPEDLLTARDCCTTVTVEERLVSLHRVHVKRVADACWAVRERVKYLNKQEPTGKLWSCEESKTKENQKENDQIIGTTTGSRAAGGL